MCSTKLRRARASARGSGHSGGRGGPRGLHRDRRRGCAARRRGEAGEQRGGDRSRPHRAASAGASEHWRSWRRSGRRGLRWARQRRRRARAAAVPADHEAERARAVAAAARVLDGGVEGDEADALAPPAHLGQRLGPQRHAGERAGIEREPGRGIEDDEGAVGGGIRRLAARIIARTAVDHGASFSGARSPPRRDRSA